MKAFLLYRDRDFHWLRPPSTFRKASSSIPLPPLAQALVQDLELNTLFGAMAGGDQFLFEVAESAVLSPLDDPSTIVYRQEILRDCLDHYDVVLELYNRTVGCLAEARRPWSGSSPRSLVFSSVTLLELFVATLRSFRAITDAHASEFRSEGFTRFFGMLSSELDDDYFEEIEQHLRTLRFNTGMLISARLGEGNKGIDYVVRRLSETKKSWLRRLAVWESDPYSFDVSPRDEAGARALGELQGRGINPVANAVAQSADHIRSFLTMLQIELAFYLGCVNLHRRLAEKREPTCYPEPMAAGKPVLSASGLYDACLSLLRDERVVGNDVGADGKALVMVTGANQGGKSTFLRSLGLAQLMMQCGMFVPADAFTADVRTGVFTHFKREEDVTMKSGKFDEELSRMRTLAERVSPGALVLFNESFAATNEQEGSHIARDVIKALLDSKVKVYFVTHMYELAHGLFVEKPPTAIFLRAERHPDGTRTFRIVEGEPQPTSHGEDVYRRIFGRGARRAAKTSAR